MLITVHKFGVNIELPAPLAVIALHWFSLKLVLLFQLNLTFVSA